jgi:putative endonuclease
MITHKKIHGDLAEQRALTYLQRQGLTLITRNYQVAGGRHRPGGEIDLIMREPSGTLVFVEVRFRADASFGGAAASVDLTKRQRIVHAARHYLMKWPTALPPCRFDVIALEGLQLR